MTTEKSVCFTRCDTRSLLLFVIPFNHYYTCGCACSLFFLFLFRMFCTCVWDLGDDFLAFPSVVYTAAPTHIHTKLQKPARRQDYPAYQKRTHVHYTSWAVALLLLLVCFADSVATVVFWRLAHALPSSAFACAGSAVSFGSASRSNTRAHIRSLFCGSRGCSQVLGGLFVLQKPSYHLLFDP